MTRSSIVKSSLYIIVSSLLLISCNTIKPDPKSEIEQIAETYVKLLLRTGQYDINIVDAYYGPKEWLSQITADQEDKKLPLDTLRLNTLTLLEDLNKVDTTAFDKLWKLRYISLSNHLVALKTRIDMLMGVRFSFEEESQLLFGAMAPKLNIDSLYRELNSLHKAIPGEGDILTRFTNLKEKYCIPADKLEVIAQTILKECKNRVAMNFILPASDSVKLEIVSGKPWGAYNWYKGDSYSLIQLNKDRSFYLTEILHYISHEGYPGHHVHLSSLDNKLYRKNKWVEYSVVPLFAPISLVSEGVAENAEHLLFSEEEKEQYLKEVIAPLAGIDTTGLGEFLSLSVKLDRLKQEIRLEHVRAYLDGAISKDQLLEALQNRLSYSEELALSTLQFVDMYRTYIITYLVATPIVANYLNLGPDENTDGRWIRYKWLVTTPPDITELCGR